MNKQHKNIKYSKIIKRCMKYNFKNNKDILKKVKSTFVKYAKLKFNIKVFICTLNQICIVS